MSKSLGELRAAAGAAKRLPTRTKTLCLAQELVGQVQELTSEKADLLMQIGSRVQGDDGETDGKPTRVGDPRRARVAEIDTELEALYAQMREHEGTLRLQAIPAGEWRRWVDANPPRETDRDENGRPILHPLDERLAYGFCNAQALADDLFRYVVSWNDEPVTEEDWQYLLNNAAPGDVKDIVTLVLSLQEGEGARAPKASSNSSSTTGTPATP